MTEDLENNLSASLNFLFLLSPLLFVFLEKMLLSARKENRLLTLQYNNHANKYMPTKMSPQPVSLTWSSWVNIPSVLLDYQFKTRGDGRGQYTIVRGSKYHRLGFLHMYIPYGWVGGAMQENNNLINSIQIFIFIVMEIMIYDNCKTKRNKTGQIKIHSESMEW